MGELIHSLDDISPKVRKEAALALGKMEDPEAVDALIRKLQDEDSGIQAISAISLGKIGDRRAAQPLLKMLSTFDREIRLQCALALGEIGDESASQPLTEFLEKEKDKSVRSAIGWALSKISSPGTVRCLLPYVVSETPPYSNQFILYVGTVLSRSDEFYKILQHFESAAQDKKEYLADMLGILRKDIKKCRAAGSREAADKISEIAAALHTIEYTDIIEKLAAILGQLIEAHIEARESAARAEGGAEQQLESRQPMDEMLAHALAAAAFFAKPEIERSTIRAEHVILVIFAFNIAARRLSMLSELNN